MAGAPSVATVIDSIYDAALDETRWPDAIAAIAERCSAITGILYEFDVARWDSRIVGTYRMDPEFMDDYRNHYAALDPWSRRSMVAEVGRATCTPELIADADLKRTEFYQDYLRPHGDLFYGLGGVIERTPHRIAILGVQRAYRAGMFDADCIAVIERIMPHLRHSYRVRHAMEKAEQQCRTLRETLHALPNPVLILDGDARIQFANRAAAMLLAARDGLCLRGGQVMAADRRQQGQFAEALARALRMCKSTEGAAPGPCPLGRPRSERPLILTFAPIGTEQNDGAGPLVAVLVDPGPAASAPLQQLSAALRLSAAEAGLLRDLTDGKSLAQIAEQRQVSVNTLRVHLSRLFQKTGTHRQAELVRFALTAGGIRPE
jgi:DNA-binding CsgD family transcriptional regulator/PAS domain-containing protein